MIPSSQLLCGNSKEHFNGERGGFHLRQQKFVDQLELISFGHRRSRADTDKLTLGELTQLRGVSGSAKWLGNQNRPDLCVSTSLLRGAHASATVADTREANKLIRLCRQHAHVPLRVSPIPLDDLTFVGFGDCGWGCVEMDPHKVIV